MLLDMLDVTQGRACVCVTYCRQSRGIGTDTNTHRCRKSAAVNSTLPQNTAHTPTPLPGHATSDLLLGTKPLVFAIVTEPCPHNNKQKYRRKKSTM